MSYAVKIEGKGLCQYDDRVHLFGFSNTAPTVFPSRGAAQDACDTITEDYRRYGIVSTPTVVELV
jgi:hypothetical protein